MMMCLSVFLLGSNFFGTLWVSWNSWNSISFARLGKFSIICSNKFSISCSSSSPAGTPMIQMLEYLKLSRRFQSISLYFWIIVSLLCSGWLFISSFCSKSPIWFESWFPSVGSLYIFLYFTFHSLYFFLYFTTILNHFFEHPDYQGFELCFW